MFIPPLAMLLGLLAEEPAETSIDRIVVVVGERVILASDLALEAELARLDPLTIPALERRRQASLEDWLVDAAIIRGLAGSTSVYVPSPADLALRAERLHARFSDEADWARFLARAGLSAEGATSLLYTRMVVERYVQRNGGAALLAEGPEADEAYQRWITGLRARSPIRRTERP